MVSDLTPDHWKVYEIFPDGKGFNLRHQISKVVILPGDWRVMKLERPKIMTKAQALELGEAAEKWHDEQAGVPEGKRRSGRAEKSTAGGNLL